MAQPIYTHLWMNGLIETPIGPVWVALSPKGLAAIEIGGNQEAFKQRLSARYGAGVEINVEKTRTVLDQVGAYLGGERIRFELALDWSGMSAFQRRALAAVYEIPYGQTRTYGQIAAQIGAPRGPRAVGRANATNPIPLVIPCHRVIGSDGQLRGYGSGEGIKTKAWLLSMEKLHRP